MKQSEVNFLIIKGEDLVIKEDIKGKSCNSTKMCSFRSTMDGLVISKPITFITMILFSHKVFAIPWIAANQVSLSFAIPQSYSN